ncbi:MAG TPA: glycosyltransferase family 4 protein [Armatimonadota bacterium]|nr:glycosyltransferase family 4 protein [Armatimonadota bacterium]
MPKILLVANTGWYLYNFRLPLARFLRERKIDVVMVSPWDAYVPRFQAEGFRWVEMRLDRRSMNPLRELMAMLFLIAIYRRERPSAVHHFTIKCVLYGTIAAKFSGTRAVVNAVTGLGHVFLDGGWKTAIAQPLVRWLYRRTLSARRVRTVVFQNPDDLQVFVDAGLIIPERTVLIRSSGVDLKRFCPRPGLPDEPPAPVVLFASRLIVEKGIYEYVEAARLLKARGVEATFQIAGAPDPGNPTSISEQVCEQWRQEGVVDLLGHLDSMDDVIAQSTVVVLPSYREGTPRILLEAAAMGKAIVTTDVPGCREAVEHEKNGLLVPVKNPAALADAIERLLADPHLRRTMGEVGRVKMVREFDDQDVARRTAAIYEFAGAGGRV